MSPKRGRVVAELGRPETLEETAARKAEASANHRKRQTVNNLVYSLLATLGILIVIVLLVPRGDANLREPVDYQQAASEAKGAVPAPLLVPELPSSWQANKAELHASNGGVQVWEIGFVTPKNQYIGMMQGFNANPTWVNDLVAKTQPKGALDIDGVTWTEYDNRESSRKVGNAEYALVAETPESTLVLLGTASTAEFRTLARSLSAQLAAP